MKYNERIREIREDHSLTQQKIADLLHIGQRTYADYESGKTRIPVDSLLVLARYYNVSVDYHLNLSESVFRYLICFHPYVLLRRNMDEYFPSMQGFLSQIIYYMHTYLPLFIYMGEYMPK